MRIERSTTPPTARNGHADASRRCMSAVRCRDQFDQRGGLHIIIRPQLHVTHEPARTLKQAARIGQCRAVKKADIDMSCKNIDIRKRRVGSRQACALRKADGDEPDRSARHHRRVERTGQKLAVCDALNESIRAGRAVDVEAM